ncbi:uncharacterized protein CANTADRAFT_25071, partial [Suhomyces tanzawaensis NRRL Y-17324]
MYPNSIPRDNQDKRRSTSYDQQRIKLPFVNNNGSRLSVNNESGYPHRNFSDGIVTARPSYSAERLPTSSHSAQDLYRPNDYHTGSRLSSSFHEIPSPDFFDFSINKEEKNEQSRPKPSESTHTTRHKSMHYDPIPDRELTPKLEEDTTFSFSEQNDSSNQFLTTSDPPYPLFLPPLHQIGPIIESPNRETFKQDSPQNSVSTSLSSNAIGLIIGGYNYSNSSVELAKYNLDNVRSHESSIRRIPSDPRPLEGPPLSNEKIHARNGSETSTISTASSASTITQSSEKENKDKRFVRYAMNTQSPLVNPSNRWQIGNVLRWLEHHNFNSSWQETFRKNEISGNRFLELSNFEKDSIIWKQFTKFLTFDEYSSVERFIELLKLEISHNDLIPSAQQLYSRKSSNELPTPYSANSSNMKTEFRKSTPIFNKFPLSTPSSMDSSSTLNLPLAGAKQRPFSYVDPSNRSKDTLVSPSHHKFFKKHIRTHSNESRDSASSVNESSRPVSGTFLKNQTSAKEIPARRGILSTLRKYGGDKAAEIVKQVLSSSSSNSSSRNTSGSNMKNRSFSNLKDIKRMAPPEFTISDASNPEEIIVNPEQRKSIDSSKSIVSTVDDTTLVLQPIKSTDASSVSLKELPEPLEEKYLPQPLNAWQNEIIVLLTKDHQQYTKVHFVPEDFDSYQALKDKTVRCLDLINIGKFTFHLTEFDSKEGAALPELLLLKLLKEKIATKLFVRQELASPLGTNTFSTTSSDSKSFEMVGENDEKAYPATPQYLLQNVKDSKVDYLNFKDIMDRLPLDISMRRRKSGNETKPKQDTQFFPLKLPFPANKRHSERQISTLLINTTQLEDYPRASPVSARSNNSFRVIRKEGSVIDFDKRRKSPYETNPPKLIPNIYSSSVSDQLKSPISATTVQTLRDNPAPEKPENERSGSIIAKRAAPPPPLNKVQSFKRTESVLRQKMSGRGEEPSGYNGSMKRFSSKASSRSAGSKEIDPFHENEITFDDVSDFLSRKMDNGDDDDEFFVKQVKPSKAQENDDDDDEDFFVKPMSKPKIPDLVAKPDDDDFFMKPMSKKQSKRPNLQVDVKMDVRPPVEEVYDNLEKYFPYTNLDKPIIDDSPDSPVVNIGQTQKIVPLRQPTISRTFSSANISPVKVATDDHGDEVLYSENTAPGLNCRRMKTIRIVANEARRKRMHQLSPRTVNTDKVANFPTSQMGLTRSNTKMWGQKVVEVTSSEIEQGFVSKLRNNKNGQFEEFAWIKGELIGRGSFGAVYLGLNVTTGEMLAVKQVVVNPGRGGSKNSDGIDALHKEVKTMKDLDHVNIVQYLGYEQKNNIYSLFLEYVAGGSIASCMKSFGKFEEQLIRYITKQVLLGLEYLHSNGILHRDLKADNLLLEIDGTCKISDFGISKRSQDIYTNNAEMSMQGTVFWMAPEVIDSIVEDKKQGYSAKVDIWSLGCVVL